jgi:hypothetical protein
MDNKKLNISLSDELLEVLQGIANEHGITVAEALKRGIATLKYINDEANQGTKFLVWRGDDLKVVKFIEFGKKDGKI